MKRGSVSTRRGFHLPDYRIYGSKARPSAQGVKREEDNTPVEHDPFIFMKLLWEYVSRKPEEMEDMDEFRSEEGDPSIETCHTSMQPDDFVRLRELVSQVVGVDAPFGNDSDLSVSFELAGELFTWQFLGESGQQVPDLFTKVKGFFDVTDGRYSSMHGLEAVNTFFDETYDDMSESLEYVEPRALYRWVYAELEKHAFISDSFFFSEDDLDERSHKYLGLVTEYLDPEPKHRKVSKV